MGLNIVEPREVYSDAGKSVRFECTRKCGFGDISFDRYLFNKWVITYGTENYTCPGVKCLASMIVSNTTCISNSMRFSLTVDRVTSAFNGATIECRVDGSNEINLHSWYSPALPFILRVNQSESFLFVVS